MQINIPVNKIGKIRISHILVPCAPCMEAMLRSATSEEVSKPKPNMTPRGYIFHGLRINISQSQTWSDGMCVALLINEFEHLLEKIE